MSPSRKSKDSKSLEAYAKRISENPEYFPCPRCESVLLPEQFEHHCFHRHRLNHRICCVWCLGKFSWSCKKRKPDHVDHLLSCFRKFMKSASAQSPPGTSDDRTPPVEPGPVPFDTKPMAEKKCSFGREFHRPPRRAFEPVWPAALVPNPLTFESDSLNVAVSCVRKYLELGNSAEWFHATVHVRAFPAFLEAVDADEGRTRTLPFSCWCGGGRPDEPLHRHLIVVSSPPGHFVRGVLEKTGSGVWSREKITCVYRRPIGSAMDLVRTIGDLCRRESACGFSSKRDETRLFEKTDRLYLFESLPRDYALPLVMQWEGGLSEFLKENFENLRRADLLRSITNLFERRRQFEIGEIPGVDLDTVLPVSAEFEPCRHETAYFLHVTGGRKLFFERNPDLGKLKRREWLKRQAEKGNLFFHCILAPEKRIPRGRVPDRHREPESARSKESRRKNETADRKRKREEREIQSLPRKTGREEAAKIEPEKERPADAKKGRTSR